MIGELCGAVLPALRNDSRMIQNENDKLQTYFLAEVIANSFNFSLQKTSGLNVNRTSKLDLLILLNKRKTSE